MFQELQKSKCITNTDVWGLSRSFCWSDFQQQQLLSQAQRRCAQAGTKLWLALVYRESKLSEHKKDSAWTQLQRAERPRGKDAPIRATNSTFYTYQLRHGCKECWCSSQHSKSKKSRRDLKVLQHNGHHLPVIPVCCEVEQLVVAVPPNVGRVLGAAPQRGTDQRGQRLWKRLGKNLDVKMELICHAKIGLEIAGVIKG